MKELKPITPEAAVEILKKHGTRAAVEQAMKILEFMNQIAKITIEHNIK